MKRDWKTISRLSLELNTGDSLLIDNTDFDLGKLPKGAEVYRFEKPEVGGDETPSAKDLRTFFWDNRKNRSLTRDRAIVWREGNRFGLGVVTTSQTVKRIN
jgi:hypothetical protein